MIRALLLAALFATAPASAADVRLLTAGAYKSVALALIPAFEAATGHTVTVDNDTAGALARRIEGGEAFDLVVVTPGVVRDLAAKGRVEGPPVELARVGIGVAVRAGAPRLDVSTITAFRQMLVDAQSVAYIDPASGGSSGIYLAGLFGRLGVAEAVGAKAVLVPGGLVASRVVDGQAQVAIHQVSEILAVPGAELIGLLPADIQNYTVYAGAVGTKSHQADAARALLAAFNGPAAALILQEKGMLPPAR